MPIIVALVVIWFCLIGFSGDSSPTMFEMWVQECYKDGGNVIKDRDGFFYDHYECLKDEQIINHVK